MARCKLPRCAPPVPCPFSRHLLYSRHLPKSCNTKSTLRKPRAGPRQESELLLSMASGVRALFCNDLPAVAEHFCQGHAMEAEIIFESFLHELYQRGVHHLPCCQRIRRVPPGKAPEKSAFQSESGAEIPQINVKCLHGDEVVDAQGTIRCGKVCGLSAKCWGFSPSGNPPA